jgi:hypothetical protein
MTLTVKSSPAIPSTNQANGGRVTVIIRSPFFAEGEPHDITSKAIAGIHITDLFMIVNIALQN